MDDDGAHGPLSPRQLAHLLESGRLSEADALRLQEGDPELAQAVLADIRARHAGERLDRAVAAGVVSEEDAARLVARVRAGDDAAELRRQVNRLTRLASARPPEEAGPRG